MMPVNPCCPRCGFHLDADCDFCPSCGAAKAKSNSAHPGAQALGWMNDAPAPASTAPPRRMEVQQMPYSAVPVAANTQDTGLATTVRTMGIVAISFMAIALIPCLGWLNYLNLTLSFITLILSIVALASAKSDSARTSALIGLLLVIVAAVVGFFRLILGGGCI